MQGVTPYLQVTDSDRAIAWYVQVFAARETRSRLIAPNGHCMNAEIDVAGTSVVLNLHVADADHTFAAALEAGASEIFPLADQFYGDRAGRIRDPFGHHWIIATRQREMCDEEIVAGFQRLFS